VAASLLRIISFPAPRRFDPSTCKRRHGISHWSSITPSSTAAAASPQSSAACTSRRSWENHPSPKPLARQIPIGGQPLTAVPRVPSSGAFGRRPRSRSITRAGRHPKPFTIPVIPASAIKPPGSTLKSHSWPRQRIVGLTRKRSFAPDFRHANHRLKPTRRLAPLPLSDRRCRSLR
jgi:hypothetical protein